MKLHRTLALLSAGISCIDSAAGYPFSNLFKRGHDEVIAPKFVIISMFTPEAGIWYGIPDFDVLAQNITVPGLSPLFPDVHCTADGDVCQFTIGEAEANAATSTMALLLSPKFDFSKTYFMVAGIAGVNPEVASIGSVAFSRFAIQFGLSYEIDAREKPDSWPTGYSVAFGTNAPGLYPTTLYGTEVFELNAELRSLAATWGRTATLNDTETMTTYRANFSGIAGYEAGAMPPAVYECDTTTSDVWFSGNILSSYATNLTTLLTNGTGTYCMTAEEDNATFEAFVRAAKYKLVDFSRIILMRSASDYDRQFPGQSAVDNLLFSNQGAFLPSLANLYLAGSKVIAGILEGWDSTFEEGLKPSNYVGDIFGTLGGTPDFGPGISPELPMKKKRSLHKRVPSSP